MRLKNKKVLVLGLGDSGRAVIKLLQKKEAHVSFYDDNVKFFDYVGFERNPENVNWDLVIVSPGIKCIGNALLKAFEDRKIPIISELDFAYLNCRGKIVAITGTNGKTTTSMLTSKILRAAGFKTFLCGNIGLPFSAICEKTTKDSVVVCEVSNFQLETSKFFRADIACVLNIKPDHLDRHGSFEEYKRVKGKITDNLRRKDLLILNLDDEETKRMVLHKRFQYFSKFRIKKGVYVWNNQIMCGKKSLLSLNEVTLRGEKNLENVLASISICSRFKIAPIEYSQAMKNFAPASHRMQKVGELDGVTYIDDSKSTNIASTIACLEAFAGEEVWLLLGGQGKEIDYDELFGKKFKIKKVICFGQDGKKIAESAKKFKYFFELFDKFDDAVNFCKMNSAPGDFVLLSPACASFDEFSSYAERGERFKTLIVG
ncbi:MAG: UDP-N-acetylmuramoyl-L-alanine--D-glutamate ligase [Clostridia bacterium]|nr:UDP-N-acetylmuramoyl-L-alanine--D-glutamate ligase [Clostridia bacterium]